MDTIKINQENISVYVARNKVQNLTDLICIVHKPDGSNVVPNPPVVESNFGTGLYAITYTPDQLGLWLELWQSATNGDYFVRSINVVAKDINDIDNKMDNLQITVNNVENQTTEILNKINELGGYVA